MGRSILAEEKVERDLGKLSAAQSVHIGLLIGQVTSQKDYVVMFIQTPSVKELNNNEGAPRSNSNQLFDDWWVVEHAREVSAALPGGLSVVGLALVSPLDLLKPLQPRLMKLLSSVTCSYESTDALGLPPPPHKNRILFHVCSKMKKHKCQTLDLSDSQAVFRPAEVRFQPHFSKWHKLESSVSVNVDTLIPTPQRDVSSLQKSIRAGLRPTLTSIASALVTVRGRPCPPDDDPLVKQTSQRKSQAAVTRGETIPVAMYLRTPPQPTNSPHQPTNSPPQPTNSPHQLGSCHRLKLNGSISCFAYVHPKASCGEGIVALKRDAVTSILSRFDSMCKDIEVEQLADQESGKTADKSNIFASCQLPRRVVVFLPGTELPVTTYCFQGDNEEEVGSDMADLLSVEPSDIRTEWVEQFPAISTVEEPETGRSAETTKKGILLPVMGIAAAIGVALVATATWLAQNLDYS